MTNPHDEQETASKFLLDFIRKNMESPMVPPELRQDIQDWFDRHQEYEDWPADEAGKALSNLNKYQIPKWKSAADPVTPDQIFMINRMLNNRSIPKSIRDSIARLEDGPSEDKTKGVMSAWIECLNYYSYHNKGRK